MASATPSRNSGESSSEYDAGAGGAAVTHNMNEGSECGRVTPTTTQSVVVGTAAHVVLVGDDETDDDDNDSSNLRIMLGPRGSGGCAVAERVAGVKDASTLTNVNSRTTTPTRLRSTSVSQEEHGGESGSISSPCHDEDDEDDGLDSSSSNINSKKHRRHHSNKSNNFVTFSSDASSANSTPTTSASASTTAQITSTDALLLMPACSSHTTGSFSSVDADQSLYTTATMSENDNSEVSFGGTTGGLGLGGGAHHHHHHHHHHHGPPDLLHQPILEVPAEEPLDANSHYAVLNFVMEDRIFLKAALDLLTERDRTAPELGMMDPIIFKSGSLKKASHLMRGVWKVKYVEIRRGMFSYFENNTVNNSSNNTKNKDAIHTTYGGGGGEQLLRKDIPLVAPSCRCRAVKLHQKALKFTPTGAIFELSYGDENKSNKRLWMAKTRADRQVWMQAINNATVGGSVTRGQGDYFDNSGNFYNSNNDSHRGFVWGISPKSPFREDLRKYMKAHAIMRNAKTRQDYLVGLRVLVMNDGYSLKVPVKWIATQQQGLLASSSNASSGDHNMEIAFREDAVELSIDQLRKDLQRDSVTINGELFRGDAGHGPERIVGALARELMEAGRGRLSNINNNSEVPVTVGRSDCLQESQALAYARDILLSGNRTRSGGDAYFCVNTLCSNQELVVVVPSGREAEPVDIEVVEDESDVGFASGVIEKSGWIKTRNKSQKEWRKLFFVLSEGTLSFYESASPRPHRLRGQIVLTDATISVSKIDAEPEKKVPAQFVMTLSKEGSTRERLLLFGSEDRLLDWTYALECTTKMKANADLARKSNRRRSNVREEDAPSSKLDIISQAEQSTKYHATNLGLDEDIVGSRIAGYARRAASAIVISIRACTEYKVCTVDPQGEQEDTWATIRADFLQSFRVNGGPNGRILRGEEIVRVSVVDCIDLEPEDPGSPRRARDRRIFRRFSTSEEAEEALRAATALTEGG